nr:DHA2 family efflux MFS transporter permease subunit [Mycobacterium marinum]
MTFLDALIVNVALPDIQRSFATGEAGIQWVGASYTLGMGVFLMSAGTLADRHGRRRWYWMGTSLFTLGSVACGLAPSITSLSTARGVQGVGAAIVSVTSLALLSAAFPSAKGKARAIGIWTAIASIGTTVGPTLGGLLVSQWGWHSVFFVNVPIGLLIVLTLVFVEESRNKRAARLDFPGQLLFIASVGTFVCSIIEGPRVGWSSPQIIVLLSAAATFCALFLWHERRTSDPMMDLTLFRDTSYTLAAATIFTVYFAVFGMLLLITQFLQNVRGYGPGTTGLMILPFSTAVGIVSPAIGRLVGSIGARLPVLAGLSMLMLGLIVLIFSEHRGPALILVGLGMCGIGIALCLTPITTIAMTAVPAERAGMASGIMSAQRVIGSTVGLAVLGSILTAWLSATLEPHLEAAVPDPLTRHVIAGTITDSANPRMYVGGTVPGLQCSHCDLAAITAIAEENFAEGIRAAFLVATATLAVVFLVGWRWFPHDADAAGNDAKCEAPHTADF